MAGNLLARRAAVRRRKASPSLRPSRRVQKSNIDEYAAARCSRRSSDFREVVDQAREAGALGREQGGDSLEKLVIGELDAFVHNSVIFGGSRCALARVRSGGWRARRFRSENALPSTDVPPRGYSAV